MLTPPHSGICQMFAIPSTNVSFFYWSSMAAWNICCMILGMSSVLRQTKVLPDGKVFFRRVAWSPRAPMNMQKTLTFRSVLSMIWEKRVGLRPCKLNNMSQKNRFGGNVYFLSLEIFSHQFFLIMPAKAALSFVCCKIICNTLNSSYSITDFSYSKPFDNRSFLF